MISHQTKKTGFSCELQGRENVGNTHGNKNKLISYCRLLMTSQ